MSILTGPAIEQEVLGGRIAITPFNKKQINPASYDLRLGREVACYKNASGADNEASTIDSKIERGVDRFQIDEAGLVLHPGTLYLMHTEEVVCTSLYVPVLDGKSSIGRLGVVVHLTAGYGDPGFNGQYTLEVTSVYPVRVYAGMRFCQIRFHQMSGELLDYQDTGHYTGAKALGPVPSQAFRQFKEGK